MNNGRSRRRLPASVLTRRVFPATGSIGSDITIRLIRPTSSTGLSALKDLGYVVGGNTVIEAQFAENKVERLPEMAAELVAKRVDIIVAVAPSAIRAARAATQTIPIVMSISGGDPVKSGFVTSLARPGGNTTGMTSGLIDTEPRSIELLRELVPDLKRVGALRSPARVDHTAQVDAPATAEQGHRPRAVEAAGTDEFPAADALIRAGSQAVVVVTGPAMVSGRARLLELAARHRLPAVYEFPFFVREGGLVAYGPDNAEMSARSAVYVDKILKGANPAELPIEQARKYSLAINRTTASALGLAVPPALVLEADEVIQ
jgi:putative ABC transport system substrate-binding protein